MKILFLHQNFPGQFLHITQALKARDAVSLMAIADSENRRSSMIDTARYRFSPGPVAPGPASNFHNRIERGKIVASAMRTIAARGFTPDLVIGHFGWGETLFVKDVFPKAKLILHTEFYFRPHGADIGFDPEFGSSQEPAVTACAKNAAILASLVDADIGVAPTRWQGGLFPKEFAHKIAILHEGIQTDAASPKAGVRFHHKALGLDLGREDEVITFVNRNLEPYRGFHIFMRALPGILAARPKAQVVIVGGEEVSYGPPPGNGRSWKTVLLDEVGARLPLERVHFVGKIPYPSLITLFRVSAAHVYLTYPFVLSWSMLEAMSTGALVIASKTAPVEEVIEDGINGLLFDFFDVEGLANRVIDALAHPEAFEHLRRAGRETVVERYELRKCVSRWLALIDAVAGGKRPIG